jgi:hypothetical protein
MNKVAKFITVLLFLTTDHPSLGLILIVCVDEICLESTHHICSRICS